MINAGTAGFRTSEDSRPQPPAHDWPQAVVYNVLAVALALAVLYLFFSQPVVYTWLVAEDHFGENVQALGFAVTAALLLALAWRPGPPTRRVLWALIGLLALFVAGEEISWGERILDGLMGISYPEAVRELNRQDEFNLHNLVSQSLLTSKQNLAALGIVVWLGISFVVIGWWPRLARRLDHHGVPLIPVQFHGLFLVAVGYRFAGPVAHPDEIWELFLALAAASWAFHLHLRHRRPRAAGGRRGDGPARLSRPARRALQQPRDPRHAQLLLAQGRDDEAAVVLAEVLGRAAAKEAREDLTILDLRSLAMAHAALGETERSRAYFERALEVNRAEIAAAEDADERALLHWELARTLEAAGDVEGTIAAVRAGVETAASAHPAALLEGWLRGNVLADPQDRRSTRFWRRVSCWLSPGDPQCDTDWATSAQPSSS